MVAEGLIYKRELDTELPSLVASASGVVVELGPGSGNQLGRYDKEKVKKVRLYFHRLLNPFNQHHCTNLPTERTSTTDLRH